MAGLLVEMLAKAKQTVAPAQEPLSVDDLKLHSRITHDDEDAYLFALLVLSREYVEQRQHRQLITATYELKLDAWPRVIYVPYSPLQSVTSIVYDDPDGNSQTLAATEYTVDTHSDPGRILPAYSKSWPSVRTHVNVITVTYVAGYGTSPTSVPMMTRQAILLLAAHMYENRETMGPGTMKPLPFNLLTMIDANMDPWVA